MVTGSLLGHVALAAFTLSKILLIAYVLVSYAETCEEPLRFWSFGQMVLDWVSLLLLVETFIRTRRARERANQEMSPFVQQTDCWSRM